MVKQSEVEDTPLWCFCVNGKVKVWLISICMSIILGVLIFFVVFHKDVFNKLSTKVEARIHRSRSTSNESLLMKHMVENASENEDLVLSGSLPLFQLHSLLFSLSK